MHSSGYLYLKNFIEIVYTSDSVSYCEYESCIFTGCDFSSCNFTAVTFIDCTFIGCKFEGSKINHIALRGVIFDNCRITDVNFAMCDKLIFEIHFRQCILDFSQFYGLKMKGTTFTNCSMISVDFMEADLSEVLFDNCDLYRAVFIKSVAIKADFTSSFNYSIDPEQNKLSKAIFSLEGSKGLLDKYEIIFS